MIFVFFVKERAIICDEEEVTSFIAYVLQNIQGVEKKSLETSFVTTPTSFVKTSKYT